MTESKVLVVPCVQLFVTPWTVACQAPLTIGLLQTGVLDWVVIGFSRRSSRPRDQTQSPTLQANSLPSGPPGQPLANEYTLKSHVLRRTEKLLPFPPLDCFLQHRNHTVENYGVIPTSHSYLANIEKIDVAIHQILSSTFLSWLVISFQPDTFIKNADGYFKNFLWNYPKSLC